MAEDKRKLIVIVGVTGTQGSSVASTFLQRKNWRVRGITRTTSSDKAKAASAKGIEIVAGDLGDVDSLVSAFQGAHAIFVATDFFSIIALESTAKQAQATNKAVDQAAYDIEVQQGVNAALAASHETVLKTLQKYIFSTLPNVSELSGGKYTRVLEFDSKDAIEKHIRKDIPRVASIMSTVTLGFFAENTRKFPGVGPKKQHDGSYMFQVVKPADLSNPDPLAYVVAGRDTGKFVEALIQRPGAGENIQGVSERIPPAEFVALWGKIQGKKAWVKYLSAEELAADLPESLREGVVQLFTFQAGYDYFEEDHKSLRPRDLGVETTSMETFIREEDWDV